MSNLTNKKIHFWPLCLMGAIVGTVMSQTLLDFFTIVLFLGIVFDFYRDKYQAASKFKLIGIEWAFVGYFIVVILGFIFNASPDAEIKNSLLKFSWVINLYIYIYAFSKIKFNNKKALYFFNFGFIFLNIYTITSYLMKYDYLTSQKILRAIGLVNSATYHAHANAILFVMFCTILYFFYASFSKNFKWFSVFCLILFFISIFLTFVRGIWISIFFSALIMSLFISYKKTISIVLVTLLLSSIAYFVWPTFKSRVDSTNIASASNMERINLFKLNIQIWKEYPLFGIGYGENLRRNREYWDKPEWNMPGDYITSHAHNQYLNVLATTGVFGFSFFLCFFSYFIIKNLKMLKNEKKNISFRYALIFGCMWAQLEFIFACLTDVTFEYAKIRALYLFIWALLIAIERYSDTMIDESSIRGDKIAS